VTSTLPAMIHSTQGLVRTVRQSLLSLEVNSVLGLYIVEINRSSTIVVKAQARQL
jgi:hypothetical protein